MNQISHAAEKNLESSEPVSHSSYQLSELSKSLNAMTGKFRFGGEGEALGTISAPEAASHAGEDEAPTETGEAERREVA